jgi:transcriptional regulator
VYRPDYTDETDPERIASILREHPFAVIVTSGAGVADAVHVPVVHDPVRNVLEGHLARVNPAVRALDGAAVLAVFNGPHGYVSPRWYVERPNVPTWNYAAIHVRGTARLLDGDAAIGVLRRLTAANEPVGGWVFDPDAAYERALMRAIVAFEIAIESIEAKLKLNQNKTPADRAGVVAALLASGRPGDRMLADAMLAWTDVGTDG